MCMYRQVTIEEGDYKAREVDVMFVETSAKAGFNIKVRKNTGFNGTPSSCQSCPNMYYYRSLYTSPKSSPLSYNSFTAL